MKKYLLFITISSLITFTSCKRSKQVEVNQNNDTIPVKVTQVMEEGISLPIEASGQFTTEDETILAFKMGGIIEKVFVKEGDATTNGQMLASLNKTEITTQVQQAKIALEKARRDNTRAENLFRDSVATLEQVQNSKTALEIALQQLNAAQFNERHAEIRSNKNGFILRKFVSEGQVIAAGSPAFQINGASQNKWILKVSVSDRDWAAISKGDKTQIMVGDGSASGIVSRKSEATDPATGSMWVMIEPTEKININLAAGAFGKAKIIPSTSIKAWLIPYDAILDGDAGEGFVFTVNEAMRAKKIKVRIGNITEGKVIITHGLDSIKTIISAGNAYLNENSPIRIIQ